MVVLGKTVLALFTAPVLLARASGAASENRSSGTALRGSVANRLDEPLPVSSNTSSKKATLTTSISACSDASDWSLHQDTDQGPCCAAHTTPSRESASIQGVGDRGWDPCCYDFGCDIFAARFNNEGDNLWYDREGNTWTGYVYDNCPCDPDSDPENCEYKKNPDNGVDEWIKPRCVADATNGWVPWEWMRDNCGAGKDVCVDGGVITAPTGPGFCLDHYALQQDEVGADECVPCPDWDCS
jgi:hypothetical protein